MLLPIKGSTEGTESAEWAWKKMRGEYYYFKLDDYGEDHSQQASLNRTKFLPIRVPTA